MQLFQRNLLAFVFQNTPKSLPNFVFPEAEVSHWAIGAKWALGSAYPVLDVATQIVAQRHQKLTIALALKSRQYHNARQIVVFIHVFFSAKEAHYSPGALILWIILSQNEEIKGIDIEKEGFLINK